VLDDGANFASEGVSRWEVMHSAKAGQRMADQSRHGNLERDTEQVDDHILNLYVIEYLAIDCFLLFFGEVSKLPSCFGFDAQ